MRGARGQFLRGPEGAWTGDGAGDESGGEAEDAELDRLLATQATPFSRPPRRQHVF